MSSWPKKSDSHWFNETKKRLALQDASRSRLCNGSVIDESTLRSLDSALKKTTAFMKKLKTLSGSSAPSLISDLSKLNLSKFVEEMAQAIAETKMKVSEVTPVVELCVEICARYGKFPELILDEIKKNIPLKKSDKVTNPAKLRVDIRFLSELILHGCVSQKEGMQALGACLTFLSVTDKTEHVHVGLFCSLCRPVGWQLAGIVPGPETGFDEYYVNQEDLSPGPIVSGHKKILKDLLVDYHSTLLKRLEKSCSGMNIVQKRVKRQERTRGDASAEDKTELEQCREEFFKLKALCSDLSSALGIFMRELKEEPSDDEEDELAALEMDKALAEGQESLWPDDETRGFYTNLLDIRKIVPKNLYKESEERTVAASREMATCVDAIDLEGLHAANGTEDEDVALRERKMSDASTTSQAGPEVVAEPVLPPTSAEMKTLWAEFVVTMDHLVNRDVTDEAALSFVSNLNNKGNRKRLVKLLISSPANRMDLLPFYARLIATLASVMPDIATEVTNALIKMFREYVQRIGEARIEDKLKCVMFISELTKFGVVPRAEALSCLRQLVYDFRGPSVDMTCTMVESVGYFLYRNSDSHPKMKIIIDVILNKKERTKDPRHLMLIDNSYFACIPPEGGLVRRHEPESPMKLFIKHLILDVSKNSIDQSIKLLRRVDWSDDTVSNWCLTYLSSPWLVPYSNLEYLASAISGLSSLQYHEWTAIHVIDSLCETIRLSLEVPSSFNQQAMACVTCLGELYNYSVCDSPVIYKVLYQLISFPEFDNDSWQDFYRIRMICELLNTVGEFFQTGQAKKKMDYFLVYFQRFYLMKKEEWLANMHSEDGDAPRFPADIDAEYTNSMRGLRGDMVLPRSLDEAERAVQVQEEQLKDKLDVSMLAEEECEQEEETARRGPIDRTLNHIMEEEEDEEAGSDTQFNNKRDHMRSDESEEEKVHVNKEDTPEIQLEDEDFMRELDRIMIESHRNAPTQAQAPTTDMSVPLAAKHRYQRQISFADAGAAKNADCSEQKDKPSTKVALMSRGKGNKAVLKTVSIEEERLHQSWLTERARAEREREDMKRVTLGHTERILKEEEEEQRYVPRKQAGFRYKHK